MAVIEPSVFDVCNGSKAEKLNGSICFPLFVQQRTFLRTAALRQKQPFTTSLARA
jgi:hypothetical protein